MPGALSTLAPGLGFVARDLASNSALNDTLKQPGYGALGAFEIGILPALARHLLRERTKHTRTSIDFYLVVKYGRNMAYFFCGLMDGCMGGSMD